MYSREIATLCGFLYLTCFDAMQQARQDLQPECCVGNMHDRSLVGKRQATTHTHTPKDAVKEENRIGFLSRHIYEY